MKLEIGDKETFKVKLINIQYPKQITMEIEIILVRDKLEVGEIHRETRDTIARHS